MYMYLSCFVPVYLGLLVSVCVCVCVCVCVHARPHSQQQTSYSDTEMPPDSPVVLMRALQGTGVKGLWTPKLLGQVTLSPGWAQFLGSSTENH